MNGFAFVCAVLLGLNSFSSLAADCPPMTMEEYRARYAAAPPPRLVFFSSWCGDCKEHLVAKHPPGTLFVATFDEKERAERAMAAFQPDGKCVLDSGIAKAFGVKVVPAEISP